jgi:hypothetical protein
MPQYDYKCPEGHISQTFSSIDGYQSTIPCQHCGQTAIRHITIPPMVKGDYPGYECPVTGQWIEGRRAHEENLKRTGCRVYEPGETEQFKKRKAAADAAYEDHVADTAVREVLAMPAAKREQLGKELDSGADVAVVRKTVSVNH